MSFVEKKTNENDPHKDDRELTVCTQNFCNKVGI